VARTTAVSGRAVLGSISRLVTMSPSICCACAAQVRSAGPVLATESVAGRVGAVVGRREASGARVATQVGYVEGRTSREDPAARSGHGQATARPPGSGRPDQAAGTRPP